MVTCLECNREFKLLNFHLRVHNMSVADYKEKYPGVEIFSKEVRNKLSKSHMGHKTSNETKKKLSEALIGHKISDNTKNKISKTLRDNYSSGKTKDWCEGLTKETDERLKLSEEKSSKTKLENFASGKTESWLKGKTKETDPRVAKLAKVVSKTMIANSTCKGKNNPMYGVSPSLESSRGLVGWFSNIIFRSSYELEAFCYFYENNIQFELTKLKVKYKDENNIDHTYNPDLEIDGIIYEIKPSNMIMMNKLKLQALDEYCWQNKKFWAIITEDTYDTDFVDRKYLEEMIEKGIIEIGQSERNLAKFERIYPNK